MNSEISADTTKRGKTKRKAAAKIQPDWWSKSFAGAVLGLTLALALSGIFAWLGPGGLYAPDKRQFNMWIIAPLWMTALSLVYLIPTGRRALTILSGLNLLAYGVLFFARYQLEGRG